MVAVDADCDQADQKANYCCLHVRQRVAALGQSLECEIDGGGASEHDHSRDD